MVNTIASIQRDEAHSPFMLERLYNQVCSKCVDGDRSRAANLILGRDIRINGLLIVRTTSNARTLDPTRRRGGAPHKISVNPDLAVFAGHAHGSSESSCDTVPVLQLSARGRPAHCGRHC